jgi:hypothetical protein
VEFGTYVFQRTERSLSCITLSKTGESRLYPRRLLVPVRYITSKGEHTETPDYFTEACVLELVLFAGLACHRYRYVTEIDMSPLILFGLNAELRCTHLTYRYRLKLKVNSLTPSINRLVLTFTSLDLLFTLSWPAALRVALRPRSFLLGRPRRLCPPMSM